MADANGTKHGNRVNPRRTIHGQARTGKPSREYAAWCDMIQRCTNPKSGNFFRYGARGITVCDRWREFLPFFADMGPRPGSNYSLDRIDNNGNYEPSNCRWATKAEQSLNQRQTVRVAYQGETKTVGEWADQFGMNRATLYGRIFTKHWPVEIAMTAPINSRPFGRGPNIKSSNRSRIESEDE